METFGILCMVEEYVTSCRVLVSRVCWAVFNRVLEISSMDIMGAGIFSPSHGMGVNDIRVSIKLSKKSKDFSYLCPLSEGSASISGAFINLLGIFIPPKADIFLILF